MSEFTILVVDDETAYCEVMREILQSYGYRVLTANHVREATDLIRDERPDLVLLDIMMPDIDGLTLANRMRTDARSASIPVIVVSAKSLPDDRIRALCAGANGFLPKPFSSADLQAALGPYLPSGS
jgi:CheY-like chemotaxis protein